MRARNLAVAVCLLGSGACAGLGGATTKAAWAVSFPATDGSQRARVHDVRFTTLQDPVEYERFYKFNQDFTPCYDDDCILPDEALQLNSSLVNDCWVQLAGLAPHSLSWDLEVRVLTTNVVIVSEPNGIVFQVAGALPGVAVPIGWHRVTLDRADDKLTVSVDGVGETVTFVTTASRTPLRLTVRRKPLVWLRGSALYVPPGAAWDAAQTGQGQAAPVVWREVYRQTFDSAESVRDFSPERTNGTIAWIAADHCMRLDADQGVRHTEIYATLKRNFPGDLRVRFRARNVAPIDHFFDVLISCKRILPVEDGYDCSWNRGWMRRIKKADVQRCLVRPGIPEELPPHWADYCIERVGGTITMYKNGEQSLTWTDPDPIVDPAYGKLSLYHCDMPVDFADFIIERNARDLSNEMAAVAGPAALPPVSAAGRDPAAADTVVVRACAAAAVQPASGTGTVTLAMPALTEMHIRNDALSFQWQVQAGAQYDVQTCNSLVNPVTWTTVPGWLGVRAADGVLVFTAPVSEHGHSFYRVVVSLATP